MCAITLSIIPPFFLSDKISTDYNKIEMSLFPDHIRDLRIKKSISKGKMAEKLLIEKGRYVKYEDGNFESAYDILKRISYYFDISIDILPRLMFRKHLLMTYFN